MLTGQIGKPWVDKFGRKRVPRATFTDNRGKVTHGRAAIAAFGTLWGVAPRAPNGRAPRPATNDRTRGSRRGERGTSSSSDDPPAEPPRCAFGCGRARTGSKYCDSRECEKQRAAARQRKHRASDRENPAAAAERRADYAVEIGLPGRPPFCRCGGRVAQPFDHQWWCIHCAHAIAGAYSEVNGHVADRATLDILREEAARGARHAASPREWRTRPSRSLAQKLARTRREEVRPV